MVSSVRLRPVRESELDTLLRFFWDEERSPSRDLRVARMAMSSSSHERAFRFIAARPRSRFVG